MNQEKKENQKVEMVSYKNGHSIIGIYEKTKILG